MIAKLNFIPILLQSLVSYDISENILLCWFDAQKHLFWAWNDSNDSKLVQTFVCQCVHQVVIIIHNTLGKTKGFHL